MKNEIETLRAETESTIRALHALKQFIVLHGSKKHVKKMNENVHFWMLFHSALLTKLFIGIRRLFETDRDSFNFQHALNSFKANINEFTPAALERRRMEGKTTRPGYLTKYIEEAYTPSAADFDSLARLVRPHKKRMTGLYSTAASKVFAHAVHTNKSAIDNALAGTNFEEIEEALNVLWHFYEQIWQLYENGRKPSNVVNPYPYAEEVQKCVDRQIMA